MPPIVHHSRQTECKTQITITALHPGIYIFGVFQEDLHEMRQLLALSVLIVGLAGCTAPVAQVATAPTAAPAQIAAPVDEPTHPAETRNSL